MRKGGKAAGSMTVRKRSASAALGEVHPEGGRVTERTKLTRSGPPRGGDPLASPVVTPPPGKSDPLPSVVTPLPEKNDTLASPVIPPPSKGGEVGWGGSIAQGSSQAEGVVLLALGGIGPTVQRPRCVGLSLDTEREPKLVP